MSTAKTKPVVKKAKAVAQKATEVVTETAETAVETVAEAVSDVAETVISPVNPAEGQKSNKKAVLIGAVAIGFALFWLLKREKPAARAVSSDEEDQTWPPGAGRWFRPANIGSEARTV